MYVLQIGKNDFEYQPVVDHELPEPLPRNPSRLTDHAK